MTVLTTSATDGLIAANLEYVPDPQLRHTIVADPKRELEGRGGFVIAVVERTDCSECYRLEGDGKKITVTGGVPLGIQYGVTHALEAFGYRFLHPWHPVMPATPAAADTAILAKEYAPEVDLRRGLHLHTLHPIEQLYDFWIPGEKNLEGAKRTIDFLVKNRGNYLEWCGLNDIVSSPAKADAWKTHTAAILTYAHARGVKVGLAIQLFGKSNLQNAIDLIDGDTPDPVEIKRRMHLILDGLPFDLINLSFGEFAGADPAAFVTQVNATYDALKEASPVAEMTATIHLGNYANLRVNYMGVDQQYYFLVRYANPAITPWIHSVMYFNLFEDAGGAYLYDMFTDHRAFLEDRLRAGTPAGYYPESAYWVAFDNSVPMYMPVYMRSRFLDLQQLKTAGNLHEHILFSSGWEWGYWQTDAATLRMSFALPKTWDEPVKDFFAVYGSSGEKLAALISRLGEAQHKGLIEHRLAAYLAGRDQLIDAGKNIGIVSQPDRHQFDEVFAMNAVDRASFVASTLAPLRELADEVTAIDTERAALALADDEPFLSEMNDGFAITATRIRFVRDLNEATVAKADTGNAGDWLEKADAELTAAKAIVSHRRKRLLDPDPLTLIHDSVNPTFYQYGYLREADNLCYWVREQAQARNLLLQTGDQIPGCIF